MRDLPRTAEVVVIGGGVIGTSALYHLARAGCTNAVLLERDTIGAGSTSKAAGGIRAQFSDELNIRMALENIRRFRVFGEEFGVEIDYKQWGYLFLLLEDAVAPFREAMEVQHRLGVPSQWLSPKEAQQIVPELHVDDLAGATFCPIDGYATPEAVAQGYAGAAAKLGARVFQGVEVTSVLVEGEKVVGVVTGDGIVSTSTAVVAAGVWTPELTSPVGLDLPIVSEKRHVWLTDPGDPMRHDLPLTIDFATGFYVHREGAGLIIGGRDPTLEALAPAAMHRLPLLANLGIRPGWWGYYAMSPDHNAVIGSAGSPDGLLYATGFSGHGFQQAPVVGEYLADIALGRENRMGLGALSVERFSSAAVKPEGHVV